MALTRRPRDCVNPRRAAFMAVSRYRRTRSRSADTVIHLDPYAQPPSLLDLVDHDENLGVMTALPHDTTASPIEMTGWRLAYSTPAATGVARAPSSLPCSAGSSCSFGVVTCV